MVPAEQGRRVPLILRALRLPRQDCISKSQCHRPRVRIPQHMGLDPDFISAFPGLDTGYLCHVKPACAVSIFHLHRKFI